MSGRKPDFELVAGDTFDSVISITYAEDTVLADGTIKLKGEAFSLAGYDHALYEMSARSRDPKFAQPVCMFAPSIYGSAVDGRVRVVCTPDQSWVLQAKGVPDDDQLRWDLFGVDPSGQRQVLARGERARFRLAATEYAGATS